MFDRYETFIKEADGAKYYYDSNGQRVTGWRKIYGDWYYFNYPGGSMGWSKVVDEYYLGSDGKWVRNEGWQQDDKGTWYYVGRHEKVVKGWNRIDGKFYYFNYPGGSMTWDNTIKGFYLNNSGKMVNGTGWLKDGITGNWYYFHPDGSMATGWVNDDTGWYFLNNNGSMERNYTDGGYHVDSEGKMVTGTGWKYVDGDWYYLNDGRVATDWLYDKGNWYYLYPQGSMAHATWINGDYVSDNGEWRPNMDDYNSENNDGSNSKDTHNTYEEPRWNHKVVSYIKGTQRFQGFVKATQDGDKSLDGFFDLGGFERDEKGVYHARQDAIAQSHAGYNDLYDDVFDLGCSMNKGKYEFETSSGKYIIWLWKGDYLNLGAGAEIGIYKGGGPWWGCDIEDAMPMTLRVEDKEGNRIIDWKPTERNWWCTGFNPNYQDRQEQNLIVYGSIDFSKHLDMWDAFYKKYSGDSNSIWDLKTKPIAKFKW